MNTLISQLLYLFDEAFQGKDWHSLLTNLEAVTPDDWYWVAPGGRRSICTIVEHVGSCKFIYQNQAFGDGMLAWDDPHVIGRGRLDTISSAVEYLRESHEHLRQSIAALADQELYQMRPHHSGKPRETRWIISVMIQHDLYHAGEINYIRALHQCDDA